MEKIIQSCQICITSIGGSNGKPVASTRAFASCICPRICRKICWKRGQISAILSVASSKPIKATRVCRAALYAVRAKRMEILPQTGVGQVPKSGAKKICQWFNKLAATWSSLCSQHVLTPKNETLIAKNSLKERCRLPAQESTDLMAPAPNSNGFLQQPHQIPRSISGRSFQEQTQRVHARYSLVLSRRLPSKQRNMPIPFSFKFLQFSINIVSYYWSSNGMSLAITAQAPARASLP